MQKIIYALLIAGSLSGCFFNEITDSETVVLLEDVIYVSSNKVRLLGRIYSAKEEIIDHGFLISKDEDFSSPQMISLGAKNDLGLFLVQFDSLEQKTEYFYRAFATVNSRRFESDIRTFSTFEGLLTEFTPEFGKAGQTLSITGTNLTNNVEVFFGDVKAEILERKFDFGLEVKIPAPNGERLVPLLAKLDGKMVLLDTFEYITGRWTLLGNTNTGKHYYPVQFQSDDKLTIGFGSKDDFSDISDQFHTLDLNTFQWSTSSPPGPTPTVGAFSTPSGYMGSGSKNIIRISETEIEYELINEFWKSTNEGFQYLGSTPYECHYGVGFELADKVYLAGGLGASGARFNFLYAYDGSSWRRLANLPFQFDSQFPYLTIGEQELFISSEDDLWLFDPTTETITKIGKYPRSVVSGGSIFNHEGQIHVGLFRLETIFYRMEMSEAASGAMNLRFVPKNNFPGNSRMKTVAHFAHSGNLYFLRAETSTNSMDTMEFWQFEPNEFE